MNSIDPQPKAKPPAVWSVSSMERANRKPFLFILGGLMIVPLTILAVFLLLRSRPDISKHQVKPAISPSAMKAVSSLRGLQARMEIGLNKTDFQHELSIVWADVKMFLESTETQRNPEIARLSKEAVEAYKESLVRWETFDQVVINARERTNKRVDDYDRKQEGEFKMRCVFCNSKLEVSTIAVTFAEEKLAWLTSEETKQFCKQLDHENDLANEAMAESRKKAAAAVELLTKLVE